MGTHVSLAARFVSSAAPSVTAVVTVTGVVSFAVVVVVLRDKARANTAAVCQPSAAACSRREEPCDEGCSDRRREQQPVGG